MPVPSSNMFSCLRPNDAHVNYLNTSNPSFYSAPLRDDKKQAVPQEQVPVATPEE